MTLTLPTVGQADWGLLVNNALSDLDSRSPVTVPSGLVADGVTDNTAAFAAAVASAPSGGVLVLAPGQYKGNLVITKPLTIRGYGATLLATVAGTKQIDIQSSNVTVEGLKLTGTGSGAYSNTTFGIYAKAADYASRYKNITLRDLTFTANANHCVQIEFAENVNVENCHASDFARAAFMILSVDGFYIDRFSAVGATMPSGVTNAYGVAISRNTNVNIATQPRSRNFIITRGYVKDINWEGIDTHGGEDGYVGQNEIYHCKVGIAIVSSANESAVSTYAPQRVIVDGNTIDAQVTDGTYDAGIVLQGAGTGAGAFVEKAGFCQIINNIVRNHGVANTSQAGGLQIYLTQGSIVTGNFVDAACVNAITYWHTNTGGTCQGNVLRDFWSSNDAFRPAAIAFVSTHNDNVVISGNTSMRGPKVDDDITVFRINERGFSAVDGTENTPILGVNNWDDVVSRVVDNSQDGELRLEAKNLHIGINDATNMRIGFRGVTPIVRPAAYTQTYSTAERTLGAYTADVESTAYTANPAALADALTKVDGNALRVAYENLRAFTEDLAQQHNAMLDDLQSYGLLA